jgi:hypothetical protein
MLQRRRLRRGPEGSECDSGLNWAAGAERLGIASVLLRSHCGENRPLAVVEMGAEFPGDFRTGS